MVVVVAHITRIHLHVKCGQTINTPETRKNTCYYIGQLISEGEWADWGGGDIRRKAAKALRRMAAQFMNVDWKWICQRYSQEWCDSVGTLLILRIDLSQTNWLCHWSDHWFTFTRQKQNSSRNRGAPEGSRSLLPKRSFLIGVSDLQKETNNWLP